MLTPPAHFIVASAVAAISLHDKMFEFLKAHQLNAMLFMSGICAVLTILTFLTTTLSPKRKRIIAFLELAAMVLLLADRFAYIYRGNASELGFWMVRICNFLVYFNTLFISHLITLYIFDLFRNEGRMQIIPRRMYVAEIFYAVGIMLLIISQFTGLYYTFDANNLYQRSPLNIICYVMPFLISFMQLSILIQYRSRIRPLIELSLLLNTIVPLIASVIQLYAYGLSLINLTVVGMAFFLYVFALIDLNDQLEESQQELIKKAVTDDLTEIPNMLKFDEDAKCFASECRKKGKEPLYLVFDIVNFQTYNDHLGYDGGDELLVEMGQIMLSEFAGEPVARESGDKFVALTAADDHLQRIANVRNRLLSLHPSESYLDIKAGAYRMNAHTRSSRHAVDRASYALKKIHDDENVLIMEYTEQMSDEYHLRQFILNNLDYAVREGHIRVFYQPVIWADSETLAGFEALVRWVDPKRGMLSPASFIPALEEARHIHLLDLCVFEQVCKRIRDCLDKDLPILPISLNFSRLDFELMDPVAELDRLTERYDIPKNYLHVEITESAATENVEGLKEAMRLLHASGYAIWLDDFGSGYSSMNVLKDFDFDLLKIDMEFLRNFRDNSNSKKIISSIIEMANKLNILTLCEGVETQEAVDFLRSVGCGRLQGYYYGRPMSYEEILQKIECGEFKI